MKVIILIDNIVNILYNIQRKNNNIIYNNGIKMI